MHQRWNAAILIALLPLVCRADGKTTQPRVQNILIITLDTTRADVLPAYGGVNLETPALDRLAREAVVFEQASTSAPLTLPAHCSLFTGLFPPHHEVRDNADAPLGDAKVTLAEVLHASGLRSAAFVASAVLGARRGLAQGFDTYSDGQQAPFNARLRRRGNVVVDEAVEWINRRSDAPFLAWVHLYDAHAPYALVEPYRTMYEDVPYLGAIAFMDAQIARLVNALETAHLLDRTMIVVAADHGEALGEHGEDGHGMLVYQSTVHVPLLMRIPGVMPKRVPDLVRLVDVMPTVLDVLGYALPPGDGISLRSLMTGGVAHLDQEAYSESLYPRRFGWSDLRALSDGRFKFVSAPRPELYDLKNDPGERRNLYEKRPRIAAAMAARLTMLGVSAAKDDERLRGLDRESVERLSALGYIAPAASSAPPDHSRSLPNPEDCISVYNAFVRAGISRAGGEFIGSAFVGRQPAFEPSASPCVVAPSVSWLFAEASLDLPRPGRPTTRTLHGASR